MATSAAAMMAKAQREVQQFLEDKAAFDAESAVAYDAPDPVHGSQLEVLVRRGIIRDAGEGRYWVDRSAIALEKRFQTVVLKVVLATVAIAVILWFAVKLLKGL
jgi:hypothetical protein